MLKVVRTLKIKAKNNKVIFTKELIELGGQTKVYDLPALLKKIVKYAQDGCKIEIEDTQILDVDARREPRTIY